MPDQTIYQPGDRVTVTITDAKVVNVDGQFVDVEYGDSLVTFPHKTRILTDRIGLTITRAAPTPQAGEVWEHPEYGQMHIVGKESYMNGATHAWAYTPEGGSWRVDNLDFSGAVRKYPPSAPPASATAGNGGECCPHRDDFHDPYGCHFIIDLNTSRQRLCPCETPVPPAVPVRDETAMLRRFEDAWVGTRDVWMETAPGSDQYACRGGAIGPYTREHVKTEYGIARDLPPVPADAEAVRS